MIDAPMVSQAMTLTPLVEHDFVQPVRISVIIPTYNRADVVTRAIESALAQTRPPTEILVIDDGSTDHTAAAVDALSGAVTYRRQENAGVSAARNAGVMQASGEWIADLDSDDVWMPDHLERIAGAIGATSGRALVYFSDMHVDIENRTLWELCGFTIARSHEMSEDPSDWFMLPRQPMAVQASVIQRAAYLRVGGMDRSMPCREDTHMFFKLGFAGPACAVAGVGAVLTSDAPDTTRLTSIHAPHSGSYCEDTISMYRDIVKRHPRLSHKHRNVLRRRLAAAYWHRGRLALGEKRLVRFATDIAFSGFLAPSVMAERTWGYLTDRLARLPSKPPE